MSIRRTLVVAALFVCAAAQAADTSFGDWAVNTDDDGKFLYAYTMNQSGEILGEYCYFSDKTCKWILGIHTTCTPNADFTVLANSQSGAMPLMVQCLGVPKGGTLTTYAFANWKSLEASLKDASRVGFALPLQSDQFTVVRFSLVGRTDAQQIMESAFNTKISKGPKGTADQVL